MWLTGKHLKTLKKWFLWNQDPRAGKQWFNSIGTSFQCVNLLLPQWGHIREALWPEHVHTIVPHLYSLCEVTWAPNLTSTEDLDRPLICESETQRNISGYFFSKANGLSAQVWSQKYFEFLSIFASCFCELSQKKGVASTSYVFCVHFSGTGHAAKTPLSDDVTLVQVPIVRTYGSNRW